MLLKLQLMKSAESLVLPANAREEDKVFAIREMKLYVLSKRVRLIHCDREKVSEPIPDVCNPNRLLWYPGDMRYSFYTISHICIIGQ